MNRIGTLYLLALTSLGALDATALEVRQSPYDKIAERNLFQLQAPTIAEPPVPPPKRLRKITLTGITTILGRRLALITIEGAKSQPPESVMLAEGQAMNGIEVKSVDEMGGVVRIVNDGEPQLLNFETAPSSGSAPIEPRMAPPPSPPPVSVRPHAAWTPEEQTALIELQRIKAKIEGDPIASILSPTEVTSEINDKDAAAP